MSLKISPTSNNTYFVIQSKLEEFFKNPKLDFENPIDIPFSHDELNHVRIMQAEEPPPIEVQDSLFADALDSLETLKGKLGGSPNFMHGQPLIEESKTFLWLPISTLRIYISNAIINQWPPKLFWELIAQKIGLQSPITQYEYVSLTIQALHLLKLHQKEIFEISNDPTKNLSNFLTKKTGIFFHVNMNGQEIILRGIEDCITIFEMEYAKAKNENRLQDFFENAFNINNLCFAKRKNHLDLYAAMHSFDLDLETVIAYKENFTVEDSLFEELRVYQLKLQKSEKLAAIDAPQVGQFKTYLLEERKNDLFDFIHKKIPDGDEESIHQLIDKILNQMVEDDFLEPNNDSMGIIYV